jgi:hypothetical protein
MDHTSSSAMQTGWTRSVFHLLFGPLLPLRRSDGLGELAAIGEKVGAASLLLYPNLRLSQGASSEVTRLCHETIDLRRRLETRLARAGVHSIDARLICEAASEMVQVVRLIARVVRCREWLRLETLPSEALELEAAAGRSVQLVAESARELAGSEGWRAEPEGDESSKQQLEELYNRGVTRAFAEFPDPVDVLRLKTAYDCLLSVVLGSDRALEALENASYE